MFIHLVFRLKFELVKSVLARRTRGTFSSSLVLILEGLVLRSKPMLLINWQQVGSPSNPLSWEGQRQAVLPGLFGWASQGNREAESQVQASTQGKVNLPPYTKPLWPQSSTVGEYLKLHRDYLRLSKEKPRLHREYLRLSEDSLRLREEYLSLCNGYL